MFNVTKNCVTLWRILDHKKGDSMIRLSKNAVVSTLVGMIFLLSVMALSVEAQNLEYKERVIAGQVRRSAACRP